MSNQPNTPATTLRSVISYQPVAAVDLHDAALCFAEGFQREPMVRHLGIREREFLPFAELCCRKAAEEGLGLAVIDERLNRVAGITIVQDCLAPPPEDVVQEYKSLAPIFALLGQMQEVYLRDKGVLRKGEVAVSLVTGIRPEYKGYGVGAELFLRSIELARASGYRTMITEMTGKTSQRIGHDLSFSTHSSLRYQDFIYKGQRIFADMADRSLTCVLMERSL